MATIDDAAALAAFKAVFVIVLKPAGISGPLMYRFDAERIGKIREKL